MWPIPVALAAALMIAVVPAFAAAIYVASSRVADRSGKAIAAVADDLRFSTVEVLSPAGRTLGSVAGMSVQQPVEMGRDTFLSRVIREGRGEVVVFVHGYNTSFPSSARRTAQMDEDLDLAATLVLFAWPSLTVLSGYDSDVARATEAEARLADLLAALVDAGAHRVVVVGHSLGAKLAMETIAGMSLSEAWRVLPRLGGIVLLSPDMTTEAFNATYASLPGKRPPVAVYLSKDDFALKALSAVTDQEERIGVVSDPARVTEGEIYLIDVSRVANAGIGHLAVAAQPALIEALRDMRAPDLVGLARLLAVGEMADSSIVQAGRTTLITLPRMGGFLR